jgi:hypothetical protein
VSKRLDKELVEKLREQKEPEESLTSAFSRQYYGRFLTLRDLSPTRYTSHEGLCDELVWFDASNPDHMAVLKEVAVSKEDVLLKYNYIESEMLETAKLVEVIDDLTTIGGFPCRKQKVSTSAVN